MPDVPRWLNHHQLQCFRVIAREGSLARASAALRVSAQTLSEHVQQLEGALGVTLFTRGARGMSLTDEGREVLGYAEGIHTLATELLQSLDGRAVSRRRCGSGSTRACPSSRSGRCCAPRRSAPGSRCARAGTMTSWPSCAPAR